jgi:UDP-glucose 4-epimerase
MVMPRFVAQALRHEPLTVYGDGEQSRSFTYVGDVVEAMVRLAQTPAAEGEVFNIAGHSEITIRKLAELVIAKTQSQSEILCVPYEDVYGDGFEDLRRRAADTSRLESVTGYRCTTGLDEILDELIDYTREAVRAL